MNALTKTPAASAGLVEQVLIKGDLASLTPTQRVEYYTKVCESVGLNPLTKPFEYITLNNKLTLYALRGCTDQLRSIYGVSVEELTESERDGVFIVTAKVKNAEGRTDMAKGAVNIQGLKGEVLANALMKTETKAKRRATLSLCGLGFLDETEVETIAGAKIGEPPAQALQDADITDGVNNWLAKQKAAIDAAQALPALYLWLDEVASIEGVNGSITAPDGQSPLGRLKRKMPAAAQQIVAYYQAKVEKLNKA